MTPKLLLGLILAGLFSMPMLAASGSVSASITISVGLQVNLSDESLVLPETSDGIAELPLEIATNDWPLTLTLRCGYDDGPRFAPGLALRFVADASPEETGLWWVPDSVEDVFAQLLPLPGRQAYTLSVRRLEGVEDEKLPTSMTLILESWSGKIVMCDVMLLLPGSASP